MFARLARLFSRKRRRRQRGNYRRGHAPARTTAKGETHVLDAHVLSSKQEEQRRAARWRFVLKTAAAAAVLVAAGAGAKSMLTGHSWTDADRTLRHADIRTNGRLTHGDILQRAGLREDQHVYDVDLQAARRELERDPSVRAATVERELPGRLVVTVEERVATAWLACDSPPLKPFTTNAHEGACLLDDEGVIFLCAELTTDLLKLPVVHVPRLPNTQPGTRTAEPVQGALRVLTLAHASLGPRGIDIVEVDAPNDWSLVAKLTDDSVITLGHDELDAQFGRLTRILGRAAEEKRRLATVNLIPRVNVPVTFFAAGAPAPAGNDAVVPTSGAAPARPALRPAVKESDLEAILGGGN